MTVIDSIDNYLPQVNELDKAAMPPGLLLAWCANLRLLHPSFEEEFAGDLLRLRIQELRGSELLGKCGGSLRADMLTETGRVFLAPYVAEHFASDLATVFGPEYLHVPDNWENYAKFAGLVTERFMRRKKNHRPGILARVKQWLGG